jgi:(S)-mandelate dehydrogenase
MPRGSPLGMMPRRRFYAGRDPERAVTVEDLRTMAYRRLPTFALEYLEGGAEEEATLTRNREAFADISFAPRTLVDTSKRDTRSELFGVSLPMPVAVAPTGLNGLFWPDADRALAGAAARMGVPFAQSTMSNDPIGKVAAVHGLRHWWQLYVFGPPEVSATLVARAREAGCEALIVTTDAQIYGNREWERRHQSAPRTLDWMAKLDAALHLRWLAATILARGMPQFANVIDFVPQGKRRFFESAFWIRSQMDQSLSWDRIARLRDQWPRKFLIKGILRPEDVVRAAAVGADAVVISNHGGRQLDYAVSPLDVLPRARAAVGDRFTIIVDGGIRRGTDVIKALALGADLVLVGRATLYGLAAAGKAGAFRALEILRDEMERNLGLLGVTEVGALGPHLLVRMQPGDGVAERGGHTGAIRFSPIQPDVQLSGPIRGDSHDEQVAESRSPSEAGLG